MAVQRRGEETRERLLDVAADGGGVVGAIDLLRLVAEVTIVPAVGVVPGEVVGQEKPLALGYRLARLR